jgi:hypothetical protein
MRTLLQAFRRIRTAVASWPLPDPGPFVILLQAAGLISLLVVPSWSLHRYYLSIRMPGPLSLAFSFLVVIGSFVVGQLYVSCVLKYRATFRSRKSARARARATQLLAAYVRGEDCMRELKLACSERRDDFVHCTEQALLAVRGEARQRLRKVVQETGLEKRWRRNLGKDESDRKQALDQLGLLEAEEYREVFERALREDKSAFVRAAALRALLRLGTEINAGEIESSPFLVRIFAAAETGGARPVAVEPAAAVSQPPVVEAMPGLLRLHQAVGSSKREAAFALFDQLIAEGDLEVAEAATEALGVMLAGPLRGEGSV